MKIQIQQISAPCLSFPQMLAIWNATSFVFAYDDCVGFRVNTPRYSGVVRISHEDAAFFVVQFTDADKRILGLTGAERVLDVVKDFVENGKVWG